ncbi:MAG: hypothetical protein ACYTBP_17425 [Planctomycetota bacterium]|jgi:hypothetical protein
MFDLNKMIFFDEDTPAGSAQEKDVDVEEMTEDQIDEMGKDDLDRVEFDEESGDATLKAGEKKEPEKPPETDKVPDEKGEGDEAKKDLETEKKEPSDKDEKKEDDEKKEPTPDEQISELEKIPKEERTEVQTLQLRHLNAERRMHKATQEAADVRKERDTLKEQLGEMKQKDVPEFEELTNEEYNDLPPDEQAEYNKEKEQHQEAVKEIAIDQAKNTFTNFVAAYKAITGDTAKIEELQTLETLPDGSQQLKNEALRTFLSSDEFSTLDNELSTYRKGKDGSYSVEQIMKAHFVVNKDKLLSDAQVAGRKQAMDDIKTAKNSDASDFDAVPKESRQKGIKKVSDLTDDEIENMSEDEYKSYVKEMELEGTA